MYKTALCAGNGNLIVQGTPKASYAAMSDDKSNTEFFPSV